VHLSDESQLGNQSGFFGFIVCERNEHPGIASLNPDYFSHRFAQTEGQETKETAYSSYCIP